MRVVGGTLRGRKLLSPTGGAVRPTRSIVREALFDILGQFVVGASFLDMFAGVGAVGIEAVSRGADSVEFVEKNRKNCGLIKQNCETLQIPDYHIYRTDVFQWLEHSHSPIDIIFADPPYIPAVLDRLSDKLDMLIKLLSPDGIIALQLPKKAAPPSGFRRHIYGDDTLNILRKDD